MRFTHLILFLAAGGIATTIVACDASTQQPANTEEPESTVEHVTGAGPEETVAFLADPDNLQPCMDHELMRLLQTPNPTAPTAAPAPTATLDTRPAPTEDRVTLPDLADYKLMFVFDRPDRRLVRAICANDIATQKKDSVPYPYGSILVMISYTAKTRDGKPVLDENGHFIREKLITYHVMRKEKDFGQAYADDRAGEWEFVTYKGDGSYDIAPQNSHFCAECHSTDANEASDFAFRVNLHSGHEGSNLTLPEFGENEVGIFLYGFYEPELTIKVGTTVTWVNNDEAAHSIIGAVRDDTGRIVPAPELKIQSGLLPSAVIQPGASFSYRFDKAGEYLYLCAVHMPMTGKIIVTE